METILLIDGLNIMISQNSVSTMLDYNSRPCGMYLGTINQVKIFIEKFRPTKVFFVMDGVNAGERRRKIYPGYKNNRKVSYRTSKIKVQDGDEEVVIQDEEGFNYQFEKIYEFLKKLPITILMIPYCEADDVISHIALKNKDKYKSIIVSSDRDYLQLINENISIYSWSKKKLYNKELFLEEFKIIPKNYIFRKILLGDGSDNIKGIKSLGPKTFDKLFHDNLSINESIENIDGFFNFIDSQVTDKKEKVKHKYISLLKEETTKKDLLVLYSLMKLSDDYLKLNHLEVLKVLVEEQKTKVFSKISLRVLVMKDQFNKLNGQYSNFFNVDKWLHPFAFLNNSLEILI